MEHSTEKIQDYIEGQLQGEELLEFEQHLQQDSELRSVVNLQKEVHEIISRRLNSGEDNLRENLFHAEIMVRHPQKSIVKTLKPYFSIAAAACVLLFGYLFYFINTDKLYELPVMHSEVVRGQESVSEYEEAVKLFNVKSYSASRNILMALITQEPDVIQYQYYVALTFYGEKNWNEAKIHLNKIAEGNSIFKEEAKYYLAVSLEKLGNKQQAIHFLKTIPNHGELGAKAQKLIKKMD